MKAALGRALMALAVRSLGESRRDWAAAMEAELETAVSEKEALSFAAGCLAAAWRGMLAQEEGRFVLTNYALALGLMIPIAAVQIGCALLGLTWLYPGSEGLAGAILEGADHEALVRGFYQAAVLPLALLLLVLAAGQVRIAWAMLDCDWDRVLRMGALLFATATTLIILMIVLFLDCSQALLQAGVLAIELAIVAMVARWHARLPLSSVTERPG